MSYYLYTDPKSGDVAIMDFNLPVLKNDRVRVLASSIDCIGNLLADDTGMLINNCKKISREDFPLYLSSMPYVTTDFELIMRGQL